MLICTFGNLFLLILIDDINVVTVRRLAVISVVEVILLIIVLGSLAVVVVAVATILLVIILVLLIDVPRLVGHLPTTTVASSTTASPRWSRSAGGQSCSRSGHSSQSQACRKLHPDRIHHGLEVVLVAGRQEDMTRGLFIQPQAIQELDCPRLIWVSCHLSILKLPFR